MTAPKLPQDFPHWGDEHRSAYGLDKPTGRRPRSYDGGEPAADPVPYSEKCPERFEGKGAIAYYDRPINSGRRK